MKKRWGVILFLVLLFSTFTTPVRAAAQGGGDGGFYFGPYTLNAGQTQSGDLVVFGPTTLEEGATLDGSLTVFGTLELAEKSRVTDDVTVFGSAEISGEIDGDFITAGEAHLGGSARITGDVSAASLIQDEGATIEGNISPFEDPGEIHGEFPGGLPITVNPPRGPFSIWLDFIIRLGQSVMLLFFSALLALFTASFWPQPVQRIGRTVVEAPIPAFLIGLLSFVCMPLILGLLAITICLSPLAIIGLLVFVVGLAVGFFSMGVVLGERILTALNARTPNMAASAILGTVVLMLIPALGVVIPDVGCLTTAFFTLILMPAAGAVVLTRFGTMPYATRGFIPATPVPPVPPVSPVPPVTPVSPLFPAPQEVPPTPVAPEETPEE